MGTLLFYALIGFFFYWVFRSYGRYQYRVREAAGHTISPETVRNSELGLFVALMAKVAKADGKVDTLEAELIGNTFTDIANAFADPQGVREELKTIFNREKEQRFNADAVARRLAFATAAHPQQRVGMFTFLVNLAFVDGELSRNEESLLLKIAAILQIAPDQVEAIMAQFAQIYKTGPTPTGLKEAYALLGAAEGESMESIKKKYRALVKKYHPDLMKAKGADEAYMAEATKKMQQINAAYEAVKGAH
ncbi:MAG: TerB family tellurite resistance protein [Campylobacterales bacterium]|nr:TerB family tellurite resistance protein [Campylobacterales bacterium]